MRDKATQEFLDELGENPCNEITLQSEQRCLLQLDEEGQAHHDLITSIRRSIEILGTQATLDIVGEELELDIET